MKTFSLIFCFCIFAMFLASCENLPDYTDEIKDTYRQANHGQVIGGLMWSALSNDIFEWPDAVLYCRDLDELGYSDWRLPTVDELRILIQNCQYTETGGSCGLTEECVQQWTSESDLNNYRDICGGNHLASCECDEEDEDYYRYYDYSICRPYSKLGDRDRLWSSTETAGAYALWINFCSADIVVGIQSYKHYVRCVRKAD